MKNKQIRYFDFSPFRVDADERLLMRGPAIIPVTPKAFELLLVLVRNSGRVVLKEDLMKTLWPDTFVEESNLSQHILQLRKVLSSSRQEAQFIVTVPGRGYRFAKQVEEISGDDDKRPVAAEGPPPQPADFQPTRRAIPWPWLVTAMLAVVAA